MHRRGEISPECSTTKDANGRRERRPWPYRHAGRPAGWIAHDPQHVCERQLAGCGCFLPHLVICTAGRSPGPASPAVFDRVRSSCFRAADRKPRAVTFGMRFTCTTIRYSVLPARFRFVNREPENRRPT